MLSNITKPQILRTKLAAIQTVYLGDLSKLKSHLTKYKVSLSHIKVFVDTALKQTWVQQWTKGEKKLNK